jgi:hypothetical protein
VGQADNPITINNAPVIKNKKRVYTFTLYLQMNRA